MARSGAPLRGIPTARDPVASLVWDQRQSSIGPVNST
jgi:hypothetical protein